MVEDSSGGTLKRVEIALTAVSAIIPGIPAMPTEWRVIFGLIAWFLVWHLLSIQVEYFRSISKAILFGRLVFITIWILIVFWNPIQKAWEAEQAALLEGDLVGAGMTLDDGKLRGFPKIQLGGTTLYMTPNGSPVPFPFFPDAGVRAEWGRVSPLFSTTVRDDDGHMAVTVSRNHWVVYAPYFSDKNYSKTALEVKNSAGHVMLQVQILPDGTALQGEWWDTQGNGIRFVRPLVVTKTDGFEVLPLGLRNQHNEALIQPMFEYPSRDHWGELVKPRPAYLP